MTKSHAIRYRPDIDGLRAIAVVAVVLFHAHVPYVSGGFIGVDVFFVLSGFLITGMLIEDHSIVRFYQRRARRILPALFFMLAVVLIVGLFILLPSDYAEFSNSAAATLAFASNVWFWRQADYFATGTELWPLLHTWSLGVEEQFYIVFPLVVILAAKLSRRGLVALFAGLALLSFALAVLVMDMGKATLTFYLSPTRAWELLVGSVLATGIVPAARNGVVRSAAASIGLLAILWPIVAYDSTTPFPGIGALPPVFGTALLIWAGSAGSHALSPLLQWKPTVFVGLISYSLYLWHWPVLAFMQYVLVRSPRSWELAAAVVAAFALAVFSWRFVERPFRRPAVDERAIWRSVVAGFAILGAFVSAAFVANGFPGRFPPDLVALNERSKAPSWRCGVTEFVLFGSAYACPINLPSRKVEDVDIVLWGDSHAEMYVPALLDVLGDRSAMVVVAYGCAPVANDSAWPACGTVQQENYAAIKGLPAGTVILAQNWPQYRDEAGARLGRALFPGERYQDGIRRLKELVAGLRDAGKRVVIVGPVAVPGYDVASVISRGQLFGRDIGQETWISRDEYLSEYENVLAALNELAALPGVAIVRVDSMTCDAERCDYLRDGRTVFADHGHFTAATAAEFAPLFHAAFAAAPRDAH